MAVCTVFSAIKYCGKVVLEIKVAVAVGKWRRCPFYGRFSVSSVIQSLVSGIAKGFLFLIVDLPSNCF